MTVDEKLARCLTELADIKAAAEERYDIEDGADGTPRPNVWMRLGQQIHALFCELEGVAPW